MKAISDTDYDAAVSNCEMDKAQLAAARKSYELARTQYVEDRKQATADVARAESAMKYAKAMLSYSTLTAPDFRRDCVRGYSRGRDRRGRAELAHLRHDHRPRPLGGRCDGR